MRRLAPAFSGHFWTVAREIQNRWLPTETPADAPWSTRLDDARVGKIRLRGWIRDRPDSNTAVLLIHGLGGNANSEYMRAASLAVLRAGWAGLRPHLRGADGLGDDVYHAGLVEDVQSCVDVLQRYERVFVVGYSLGGHLALRYALDPDPRVAAVVAIGAPLDLTPSAIAFDRKRTAPYRRTVLQALKAAYLPFGLRHRWAPPVSSVTPIRWIAEWDQRVILPRFGFESREHYYTETSVAPCLRDLKIPALYLGAEGDPMIPSWTIRPALAYAGSAIESYLLPRGGHVGFPSRVELFGRDGTLEDLVMHWLAALCGR